MVLNPLPPLRYGRGDTGCLLSREIPKKFDERATSSNNDDDVARMSKWFSAGH